MIMRKRSQLQKTSFEYAALEPRQLLSVSPISPTYDVPTRFAEISQDNGSVVFYPSDGPKDTFLVVDQKQNVSELNILPAEFDFRPVNFSGTGSDFVFESDREDVYRYWQTDWTQGGASPLDALPGLVIEGKTLRVQDDSLIYGNKELGRVLTGSIVEAVRAGERYVLTSSRGNIYSVDLEVGDLVHYTSEPVVFEGSVYSITKSGEPFRWVDGGRLGEKPFGEDQPYKFDSVMRFEHQLLFTGSLKDGSQVGLYLSDGTLEGTRFVKQVPSRLKLKNSSNVGTNYFFENGNGGELWYVNESDAINLGTVDDYYLAEDRAFFVENDRLYTIIYGQRNSSFLMEHPKLGGAPEIIQYSNNRMVFRSNWEYWKTDFTYAGTKLLDLPNFHEGGSLTRWTAFEHGVAGINNIPDELNRTDYVLWVWDQSTNETNIVRSVGNERITHLELVGNHAFVFVETRDETHGSWVTRVQKINVSTGDIDGELTLNAGGAEWKTIVQDANSLLLTPGSGSSRIFSIDLPTFNSSLIDFPSGVKQIVEMPNGDLLANGNRLYVVRKGTLVPETISDFGHEIFGATQSGLVLTRVSNVIYQTDGTAEGTVEFAQFPFRLTVESHSVGGSEMLLSVRSLDDNSRSLLHFDSTGNLTQLPDIDLRFNKPLYHDGQWFFYHDNKLLRYEGALEAPETIAQFPSLADGKARTTVLILRNGDNLVTNIGSLNSFSLTEGYTKKVISKSSGYLHQRPDGNIIFTNEEGSWLSDGTVSGTRQLNDLTFDFPESFNVGEFQIFESDGAVYAIPEYPPSQHIFVTNSADQGPGSFRQAILEAESRAGHDVIRFDIPVGTQIQLTTSLPTITESVDIVTGVGTRFQSAPGINYSRIDIDGSLAGTATGLTIMASDVVVQGLNFHSFSQDGILIENSERITLSGIGSGVNSKNEYPGNGKNGLRVENSRHVSVRDSIFAGNELDGILTNGDSSYSVYLNNTVGGLSGVGAENRNGMVLHSAHNIVRDNEFIGNQQNGIAIFDKQGKYNRLERNKVGLTHQGVPAGNGYNGIFNSGHEILIGDYKYSGNVIRNNGVTGIYLKGSSATTIHGNTVGSSRDGEPGNVAGGVRIVGSPDSVVQGNRIADNGGVGLFVGGTKSTGTLVGQNQFLLNAGTGLVVNGGTDGSYLENFVFANEGGGAFFTGGSTQHRFLGNSLWSNSRYGFYINSDDNVIGNENNPNNFVNEVGNVVIRGDSNEFQFNIVGEQDASESELTHVPYTLFLAGNASDNRIADNQFAGVVIGVRNLANGTGNRIRNNTMAGELRVAIDAGQFQINPNDKGDSDEGPNRLQNHPELSGATLNDSTVSISYFVDSESENATYPLLIEFFLIDEFDGIKTITPIGTDLFIEADFALVIDKSIDLLLPDLEFKPGMKIAATATDDDGNTSELGYSIQLLT